MMVRDFHRVIGIEARAQILEAEARLPDLLVACVGGGSNAIGLFHAFLDDADVKLLGVEAGGRGTTLGEHAARMAALPDIPERGPACCREHILTCCKLPMARSRRRIRSRRAWIIRRSVRSMPGSPIGHRAEYTAVSDDAAVAAARTLARMEGIIPALESAHALAELIARAPKMPRDSVVILNLSGRGDKDMEILARYL